MRYERSLAVTKRLGDLLALIKQGTYSSPILAEKLSVSEQTVYRDIECLKHQGYQIRSVKGSSTWAYQVSKAPQTARGSRREQRP